MNSPFLTLPRNQFLRDEADSDHQELQPEPFRLEPQKQIDAEHDRQRGKSEPICTASRPGEEHLDAVGENNLRQQQMCDS